MELYKFPRTPHLEGSKYQIGDNLEDVPFSEIKGKKISVAEKVDGANCGISFSAEGTLYLQSRGHFLSGGKRERHFDLFKTWAKGYTQQLFDLLRDRYVMYGEWLYAKHTIYYDKLPHYFLEFDIFDSSKGIFLDTGARMTMLEGCPFVRSVPSLYRGPIDEYNTLMKLMGSSRFIGEGHMEKLVRSCSYYDKDRLRKETDPSSQMEGIYIKVEDDGMVQNRLKFVRASFLTTVNDSESHWLDRTIVPNSLAEGISLF